MSAHEECLRNEPNPFSPSGTMICQKCNSESPYNSPPSEWSVKRFRYKSLSLLQSFLEH